MQSEHAMETTEVSDSTSQHAMHMATAYISSTSNSASKSSIRNELLENLCNVCVDGFGTQLLMASNSLGTITPGLDVSVAAAICDITACQGALYAPPSVKKIVGSENEYYIAEEMDTVREMCKRLQMAVFGHLADFKKHAMVTYCLADQSEHVMTIKGIERLKNRSGNTSRYAELEEEVHAKMHCSIAKAYENRLFCKNLTRLREATEATVDWYDPENPEDDERIVTLQSADELLENLDNLIPGPFFMMMRDRTVGRRAIIRRFTLYVANEMYMEPGHVVVFWGGAHCLHASDFSLEGIISDEEVARMAVMIYKKKTSEDAYQLDRMMAETYFSEHIDDLQPACPEYDREVIGVSCAYGGRMVLVNRQYPTMPFGEADHGFVRVLRHLPRCPFMNIVDDDGDHPAVLIRATDTDVLLYTMAQVAQDRIEDSKLLPDHIYLECGHREMRYVNVRLAACALAALVRRQSLKEDLNYLKEDAEATLSAVAFMILCGASDYVDSLRGIGPKAVIGAITRFLHILPPLVTTHSTPYGIQYRLDPYSAYCAIIYAIVAAKKRPPTAKSKSGLTDATRLDRMTETDLCSRSIDELCDAIFSKVINGAFEHTIEIAADILAKGEDDGGNARKTLVSTQKTIAALPPAPEELAVRFAAVNKTLAAMLENNDGAIVDLPELEYGFSPIDATRPTSKVNIRMAHVWPPEIMTSILQSCA